MLVDHVDRLVRQVAVVDVTRRKLRRGDQGIVGVLHVMMRFETAFEPAQDLDGLGHARFGDVDFLETSRQGAVLFEHPAELLERRRTDASELVRA